MPRREPPPGWTVDCETNFTTGSFGCYPPGSKVGSERTPRVSAAGETDAIEAAWEWVEGKIPLHYMSVTRFKDDTHCATLVRYHLGLPMDPFTRKYLDEWYEDRRLTPEERKRKQDALRKELLAKLEAELAGRS